MQIISESIRILHGHKVILDSDLTRLYGVTTKVFNQAVKRNLDRFPQDFMFQLTDGDLSTLRSHNVTSRVRRRYFSW
ncbi:MAG: ORF6N domain-containing protein [Armatimonadota bacterium]